MRYADSSALAKAVLEEEGSAALRSALAYERSRGLMTSIIARTEVAIAIARRGGAPERLVGDDRAYMTLHTVTATLLDVTPPIARLGASLGADLRLRTLDAIHVATAVSLGAELSEVITYDRRMAAACTALGIRAVAPGS